MVILPSGNNLLDESDHLTALCGTLTCGTTCVGAESERHYRALELARGVSMGVDPS